MFRRWLSKFTDDYSETEYLTIKNNCVIFHYYDAQLHVNVETKTYSFYKKTNLSPYNEGDCLKNTILYLNNPEPTSAVCAYDPDNDTCYYKNLDIDICNPESSWEDNSFLYAFRNTLSASGQIIRINKHDLEVSTLQTSNYEGISFLCGKPVIDGNVLYIGVGYTDVNDCGLVRLCLNTLQWSRLFKFAGYLNVMFKINDLIYFITDNTFQSYNLSNNKFSEALPCKGVNGYCFPLGGGRFAFPFPRENKKTFDLNFSFNILCLDMTLKDLAIEAIVKHDLDISVLPKSLQEEINPLKYFYEYDLEIFYE